jgi:hypothetical protein
MGGNPTSQRSADRRMGCSRPLSPIELKEAGVGMFSSLNGIPDNFAGNDAVGDFVPTEIECEKATRRFGKKAINFRPDIDPIRGI